jgi:hypothetical protein
LTSALKDGFGRQITYGMMEKWNFEYSGPNAGFQFSDMPLFQSPMAFSFGKANLL